MTSSDRQEAIRDGICSPDVDVRGTRPRRAGSRVPGRPVREPLRGLFTAIGLVAAVAASLTTSPVARASSFSGAAKALAHTVFTAEEVYFVEHLTYTENKTALVHLLPRLAPRDFSITATHITFTVSIRTNDGGVFRMALDRDGKIRRTCSPRSASGCVDGRW